MPSQEIQDVMDALRERQKASANQAPRTLQDEDDGGDLIDRTRTLAEAPRTGHTHGGESRLEPL